VLPNVIAFAQEVSEPTPLSSAYAVLPMNSTSIMAPLPKMSKSEVGKLLQTL
jgi:hypothetical protein